MKLMTQQDKFEQWYVDVFSEHAAVKPTLDQLRTLRVLDSYRPDQIGLVLVFEGWKGKARYTGLDPEMGFILEGANEGELAAYDYGCRSCEDAVRRVIYGDDKGEGATNEPWNSLRNQLLRLKEDAEKWRAQVRDGAVQEAKGR